MSLLFALHHVAAQTTVNLISVADTAINSATSLFGYDYPDNNYGQDWLMCGANSMGQPGRSLVQFDLSSIPAGATITSATVTMTVIRVPPGDQRAGPSISDFNLYNMLVPWVEGTGGNNPYGSPALPGETTWNERGADGVASWGTPGGEAGVDYASNPSTSAFVGTQPANYNLLWGSTPQFVSDVQSWLNDPATNYGFMMISDGEGTAGTARRLASRETADPAAGILPPTLTVIYTVPEPGASMLLAAAMFSGMVRRRRRANSCPSRPLPLS